MTVSAQNLSVSYGRSTIVHSLSFGPLEGGTVVGLIGPNAAGKSTLVKLLARLYDPDEGRILLDGRDLRDYDLDDLRANIGVIFQDFVRYHLTAAEHRERTARWA